MPLQALKVVNSANRNEALDVFRAIAVVSVVLFHFNHLLPYGFLGVDLFFVISGMLVSGVLTRSFFDKKRIRFSEFFLQRGFKIWPSYFAFLLAGGLLAKILYHQSDPEQIIPLAEMPKYIFFYKNFAFEPVHPSFDQTWSLCVEEHFYVLLPLLMILLQHMGCSRRNLFLLTLSVIVLALPLKLASLYYTASGDTSVKSHTRIDALAWGMLLNLLITCYPNAVRRLIKPGAFMVAGLLLAAATIAADAYTKSVFYNKIVLHTLMPFAFFLMIIGLYHSRFPRLKPMRFIAYYSYNWYLWHTVFVSVVISRFGFNPLSAALYLAISFATAMLFTILIEEPFLALRMRWNRSRQTTDTASLYNADDMLLRRHLGQRPALYRVQDPTWLRLFFYVCRKV